MKTANDKRKINFIIACGYCLVVIVILFNYLSKSSRRDGYREGTRAVRQNQALSKAGTDLEDQLKEQKRMNKEMREMLIDIQNAKSGSNSSKVITNTKVEKDIKKKELVVQPVLDLQTITLPELNPRIEEKFKKDLVCPFNLDRNPFASPVIASNDDVSDSSSFPGHVVICDPKLPFVFSGINTELKIISNY